MIRRLGVRISWQTKILTAHVNAEMVTKLEKYSKCPFLKEMKEANLKNTRSVRS